MLSWQIPAQHPLCSQPQLLCHAASEASEAGTWQTVTVGRTSWVLHRTNSAEVCTLREWFFSECTSKGPQVDRSHPATIAGTGLAVTRCPGKDLAEVECIWILDKIRYRRLKLKIDDIERWDSDDQHVSMMPLLPVLLILLDTAADFWLTCLIG
jgi:hypothetical protein